MLLRIVYALGVLIIAIILCMLIGALLIAMQLPQIGNFLQDDSGWIGVVCGICYFFFGPYRGMQPRV